MSKISPLLLCLCFGITSVFAQTTPLDSFYKTGTCWTTMSQTAYGFWQYSKEISATFISGDSTIGTHNYKLLKGYKKGRYYYDHTSVTLTRYDSSNKVLIGGIRGDGEKVYFINLAADTNWVMSLPPMAEAILYDFDLKVGDTLAWKPYRNVVDSIDSVQLSDNTYEKRFHFSVGKGPSDTWIRGVGSNMGFLNSYYEQPYPGMFKQILVAVCYSGSKSEYIFYEHATNKTDSADFANCYLIFPLSVNNTTANTELQLYPNPVSDNGLTLVLPRGAAKVSVYNTSGAVVEEYSELGKGQHRINAPQVAGLYLVNVKYEDGSVEHLRFQKL